MSTIPEAFPVATFVKDEMEARGWTMDDLLDHMPGDRGENGIWLDLIFAEPELTLDIRQNMRLGDPTPLAFAFGTSKELWTNIDDAWHAYQMTL